MAGLKGRRWANLCQQIRQSSDVHVCHWCRRIIDLDAEPRTRWSFSVDHKVPRSRGGAPYERSNLATAHYGCNSSKGARSMSSRPKRMSRGWH
jgi:5-methylcytosine-specific restriction endonuclease McrA